jgi:hypothetical protein
MAISPYHNYTLNDLIQIIEHTALDLMGDPIICGIKSDKTVKTMAEVSYENCLIANHNAGIAEMARQLIVTLAKEADPDG